MDIDQLGLIVRRAFQLHGIENENRRLEEQVGDERTVLGMDTAPAAVLGSLDDVVRAHDTLTAYAHAAVRAPSAPGLLAALREGMDAG